MAGDGTGLSDQRPLLLSCEVYNDLRTKHLGPCMLWEGSLARNRAMSDLSYSVMDSL